MGQADALQFSTFGVFKVTAQGGEDVTPRAQKSCALLAILLESPKKSRSRAVLQDMLWSDREQAQGAASLRQALTVIRQSFGAHKDVLSADLHVVSLDESRVAYHREPRQGEFLEGIAVRDPEFEDWLRDRRMEFEVPYASPLRAAPRVAPIDMPVLYLTAEDSSQIAQYVVNAIAKGVADWGAVDRRARPAGPGASLEGEDAYLLRASDATVNGCAALQVSFTALSDGRILWQNHGLLSLGADPSANLALSRFVNDCIDRTTQALSADLREDIFYFPVRRMFATQGRDYEDITRGLDASAELTGRGVYSAWRAYMTIFQYVDRRYTDALALQNEAEEHVRRALESEAHNPTVLAIASMVNSTTLRNYPVARELAERCLSIDDGHPLGWAFLAALNAYEGKASESFDQIRHARAISGEGAYRYVIDALACVSSVLMGRIEAAVQIGETVHARMPDYAPNLRYLLGAYLITEDMPKVERTVERLRRIEPDFTLSLLAEPGYPVHSLRSSNLLSLKRLPKSI